MISTENWNTISVNNYLSQSWIYKNRYYLSRTTVDNEIVKRLSNEAAAQLCLKTNGKVHYTKDSSKVDLCEWLQKNCRFQLSLYDYEAPPGYVGSADFFGANHAWTVVLLTFSPYAPNIIPSVFTSPKLVTTYYTEKDEEHVPKSFFIEDAEIGWVGYNTFDDCVFVHHIQIRGSFKNSLSNNDKLWIYRYLIRTFVQLLPKNCLKTLFVPDAATISLFTERVSEQNSVIRPYSKRVLQGSDFHRADWTTFEKVCPSAAKLCNLPKALQPHEIHFWRYNYDDPHALAYKTVEA